MAKPMTKSKIVAAVAEKVGIPKKQSVLVLETLARWRTRRPRTASPSPASGSSWSAATRPAWAATRRRARRSRSRPGGGLKFVVAKAAKDGVLGAK